MDTPLPVYVSPVHEPWKVSQGNGRDREGGSIACRCHAMASTEFPTAALPVGSRGSGTAKDLRRRGPPFHTPIALELRRLCLWGSGWELLAREI